MRWVAPTLFLLFVACAAPGASRADVIYTWEPISTSASISSSSGELIVTDSAWQNGHGHVVTDYEYPFLNPGAGDYTNSPILYFSFTVNGIQLTVSPLENDHYAWLISDLQFQSNSISGILWIDNTDSTVLLSSLFTSGNPIWDIGWFSSDNPAACHDEPCSGATGRWILVSAPIQVSEPSGFPLFLLGLSLVFLLVFGSRAAHRSSRSAH